ncbi:hypothetical protein RJ639_001283 [Escallonia herrerae]|uniref:Pre-rRNA-processing protein TSR2 homolog n=1 Tax=Escallonia herrerae TaxID=1293975 RepID=A0AA89BIA9_9ASTE|nr:hypothetical protein RJ639_001283 [Escallonia herrerae]
MEPTPAPSFPCCPPKPDALSSLREGIFNLLSRWTALQIAVENEWGGRDSIKKSEQLASDILSLLSQLKGHRLEYLVHNLIIAAFDLQHHSMLKIWRIFYMRHCYLLSTQRLRMAALRRYIFYLITGFVFSILSLENRD